MNYNAIKGLMTVTGGFFLHLLRFIRPFLDFLLSLGSAASDTTFVGFRDVCSGERNYMFITNPLNEDLQHPVHVSAVKTVDSTEEARVFVHRPDVG